MDRTPPPDPSPRPPAPGLLSHAAFYPTLAMLAVLSTTSLGHAAVSVLAPDIAPAAGLPPTSIGFYVALTFVSGMIAGGTSGHIIARLGPIRLLQIAMLGTGLALLCVSTATPLLLALSAILAGAAVGPFNPASAQVLSGLAPARWQPFIFSLKQCGVPLGGALAGALVPLLATWVGWRHTFLWLAVLPLLMVAILMPLRGRFDAGARERREAPPSGARAGFREVWLRPLELVLRDRLLRRYALAAACFSATQLSATSFHVVYLTQSVGMSLVVAGGMFAFMQGGGIAGRILWGSIAGNILPPAWTLGLLGLSTGSLLAVMTAVDATWSRPLVGVLSAVLGLTAMGWNGIMLAEIAGRAPVGLAAHATAGLQVIMFFGIVTVPPLFGSLVELTGSYLPAYAGLTVLAAGAGWALLAAPHPPTGATRGRQP